MRHRPSAQRYPRARARTCLDATATRPTLPRRAGCGGPWGIADGARVGVGLAVAALVLAGAPRGSAAQFGPVEALASRVSDLSFYAGPGGLMGGSSLESSAFGVWSFGVELLFEVATIPTAEARRRQAATPPTTRRVLRRVEVRHTEGRADTVYHYEVEHVPPPPMEDEILWTLEVGIGYGQVEGFSLRDPELELNTTIRNLPAVTVYLTYEPLDTYVGFRTGFMRTDALQVVDGEGGVYRGRGEAFLMGALVGYAFPVPPAYLFLEGGYTRRAFPSVEWTSTPGPLAPGVPLRLDASGWSLVLGIQFPVR
jgi:hypothetical protein